MPGYSRKKKLDPTDRNQMSYKDHIEKQIKRGKLDKDCLKGVSLSRDRDVEGVNVAKVLFGINLNNKS